DFVKKEIVRWGDVVRRAGLEGSQEHRGRFMMMEGFKRTEIKTSGANIVTVHGGNGPPLLLMQGNPLTHLSWHKFAPRLAKERAAILDIIPQHHLLNHVTRQWGQFSWHWFFNIQPEPLPEKMMGADPDWFIQKKLAKTPQGLEFFGKEALAEYMRCFRNPETIRGMCEDYRACASVDLAMDTADMAAGRKVTLPVQLLWGATGAVGRQNKPAEVWKTYA